MEGIIKKINSGFTIIEIIIVIGIVGIMISGILPLYLNVITANKSAAYYSNAYKIADSMIEEYRTNSFDSIVNETVEVTELPEGSANLIVSSEIDGVTESDIKELDLTISWNFNRTQSIRIVTYVAKDGL